MKNFFITVVCTLVLLCSTTNVMAQREGLSEVGINFGYAAGAKGVNNLGIGIKYGYMLSDALRIEASGMYYFKSPGVELKDMAGYLNKKGEYTSAKDCDWFDINLNAHYLFNVADQFSIYPIFGFSTMFGKTKFDWGDKGTQEALAYYAQYFDNTDLAGYAKDTNFSDKHFRFGVNLGFGAQYEITEDFAVTLEAKYKLIKTFGHFNIALGCVVLF